jgi:transposase
MQDITLIGIDLGKHSFHVHGQDRQGKGLLRKKFGRKQLIEFFVKLHARTVVMEACAGPTAWHGSWPVTATRSS